MNPSTPPELPPVFSQPNQGGTAGAPKPQDDSGSAYNILADKIGGVPNLRKKDNVFQAQMVGVFLLIGCGAGWVLGGWPTGVGIGALGGLISGTLISGFVLMIRGLKR
ncbi:hypothetical protein [Prosthecobacter sp.]|uniref:hypothetical protein n=1 Tax=Prosthecobacter sp. TaxID=1965333 RepID=UPI0037833A4F